MARLITSGLEIASSSTDTNPAPDGVVTVSGATATKDTSVFRSGASSAKIVTSGGADVGYHTWTFTAAASVYARVYVRASRPGSVARIATIYEAGLANVLAEARLNTDGTVGLWVTAGGSTIQRGSYSASALDDNTSFYRIELYANQSGVAGSDAAELRLDGTTVASWTGTYDTATNPSVFRAGWIGAPGASETIYLDDVAINDTSGSDQASWPGAGNVVLLKPISDNQRGTWQGAAGGTTNLYDAVDNTPPAGVATATESNTSQIESQDSSGDNTTDEYRANLTTYTTAGIASGDTINVVHPVINHGEQVNTGTKTGKFGLQSNPANTNGGGETSFTYGADVGAVGAWPSNWRWTLGTPLYNPSVTLGSSPVLAVRKTDGGTRWAHVDFMGVYADYTPAVATNLHPHFLNQVMSQAVNRASTY